MAVPLVGAETGCEAIRRQSCLLSKGRIQKRGKGEGAALVQQPKSVNTLERRGNTVMMMTSFRDCLNQVGSTMMAAEKGGVTTTRKDASSSEVPQTAKIKTPR